MGQVALLGGLPRLVYSTVLTVDALTLDTGANVIPAGFNILEAFLYARTDEATSASTGSIQFNGDTTGGNYDQNRMRNLNATVTGAPGGGAALAFPIAGANDAAGVYSALRVEVPSYAGTVGNKAAWLVTGVPDPTSANSQVWIQQFQWRSTAAINRVAALITSGAGQKFKAGSALYVYVR